MKILIKATNLRLTPDIEKYVLDRIGSLTKFLGSADSEEVEARVEVGLISKHHQTGNIFRAEVNLNLLGQLLRAEAEEGDLKAAIDAVKEELQEEIKKYKGKRFAQYKRGARLAKKLLRLSPLAWFRKKGGREREEGM